MRYNRFLLGAALVLAALIGVEIKQANSETLNLIVTNAPYYKFGRSSAQVIHSPRPTSEAGLSAQANADARWAEYCNPKIVIDAFNVGRYQYAHAGCEFGKSAD